MTTLTRVLASSVQLPVVAGNPHTWYWAIPASRSFPVQLNQFVSSHRQERIGAAVDADSGIAFSEWHYRFLLRF